MERSDITTLERTAISLTFLADWIKFFPSIFIPHASDGVFPSSPSCSRM